jgi:hypothetical protein
VTDNTRRADIVAVMGATGAGKSSSICEALGDDGARRLIGYDPGEDYGEYGQVVHELSVIHRAIVKGASDFRFIYRPSINLVKARGQFDALCQLAYYAGELLLVADELQDVMLSNWAPPWWCALVRKGRKRGVRIIAASQRPAGIEKGLWSMATMIRSGRLNHLEDARTVGQVLMVEPAEVMALPQLHWIQRSIYKPAIVRGRIEWRQGRPHSVVMSEKSLPGQGAAVTPP